MKLRNKTTGEIWDIGKVLTSEYPCWKTLNHICEDWEDAEDINVLSEPLIKDEEIREIIRAWAKVNDAMKLKYNYDENSLDDIYRNTITFNMGLGLKDGEKYTIAELCGGEEE